MIEWMDGKMDGWMNGRMNIYIYFFLLITQLFVCLVVAQAKKRDVGNHGSMAHGDSDINWQRNVESQRRRRKEQRDT